VQIAAAVPVGARGIRSVAVAVTEARPDPAAQVASDTAAFAARERRAAEAVVFPREGPRADVRREELRRARAAARYREHAR
jgi:hypothetical protein